MDELTYTPGFMTKLYSVFVSVVLRRLYKIKEEGINLFSKDYVTHVTVYKAGNLGDTVLSQCVRKTLGQLCGVRRFKLISVREPVDDKIIDTINKGRCLIVGGGGLFLPDTNKNKISGWQWGISPDQLNRIKVPIIIYSVGYNYFRGQIPDELFINNLNCLLINSVFVGLRNSGSVREVKNLVLPENENLKDKICLQPCTSTLIRKLYGNLPAKRKNNNIAFNVAFDRLEKRYGEDRDVIMTQIATAMRELIEKGYNVYYVAHCRIDMGFKYYLTKESVSCKIVDMTDWFPRRAISFYNNMECVIGMRGHSQMIPFGLNCKIITLGTHEKMKWFLEDINSLDWYIELTEDVNSISKRILDTFDNIQESGSEILQRRLYSEQDRLWDITESNSEQIRLIING